MNDGSIVCRDCQRGTKIRRITHCHGRLAAFLGTILLVVGGLSAGAGLLLAFAAFGKRDGPLVAITVAVPLIVGGMLVTLAGALAARKKSVLWCDVCWATSECVDVAAVEVPESGPGSEFWDDRLPLPGTALRHPSANP